MREIIEGRTLRGKIYDLEDPKRPGRRRIVASIAAKHVPTDFDAWKKGDSVTWDDIDHTLDRSADGQSLLMRKGWYGLELLASQTRTQRIGYTYTSKLTGGTLEVELVSAGEVEISRLNVRAPRVDGRTVWWDDVVPGLDIFLQIQTGRIEIYKQLRDGRAPRVFVWKISEQLPSSIPLSTATMGWDNHDRSAPDRIGMAPWRCQRLVMTNEVGRDDLLTRPGWRIFTVTETWTGEVVGSGGVHRSARYPILIDQDISETIAADGDDGNQVTTTTWENTHGSGVHFTNANNRVGYRFQTIAVGQGDTIDAATLTVKIQGRDSTPARPFFGNDTDDAPAWATGAGPVQMTPTTATVSFAPTGAGTNTAMNVAAIVQEIVNRGGWASGNDMAFGEQGSQTASGYAYIYDFAHASEPDADLTIDFTAAGGGGGIAVPIVYHHRQRR